MPAYVVSFIRIIDAARYQEYAALATVAMALYEGKFVVRGGAPETLEGQLGVNRVVVAEFASRAAAQRFYDSPEYRAARAVRAGAAEFNMTIVDGA